MARLSFLISFLARAGLAAALLLPQASWADTTATAAPPTLAAQPAALSPADARAIAAAVNAAAGDGLSQPDIGGALQALAGPDPAAQAAADRTLGAVAVRLAGQRHGMRIDPRAIDKDFALRGDYDPGADFLAARLAGRVPDWAAGLTPTDPAYLALTAARARYAAIVAAGGWAALPAGKTLKVGERDARAPALRDRLALEGYAAPTPAAPPAAASAQPPPDRFDPALAAALAAFQAHHALKPDGVLTADTTAALNVDARTRLAAIDANLERLRWLPSPMPADRVEVDIGDPQAVLFRAGQPALSMRAIVGDLKHHTPTFASEVTAIVFNPPWVVPTSIAAAELYPKERRHPGYFARNGFQVINGQLVQRAGPKAALGYLKFDMPDPFQVYLHDTPSRSLFTRDKRWLSHGCLRLQLPRDLAAALLAPQGWDRAAVDAAIAAKATRSVALKVRPPVFVVYRTALADAQGQVTFRPDVYGWDAELTTALASR